MDISFREDSADEKAFRMEVRAWLAKTLPDDLRGLSTRSTYERTQWWHKQIFARGWIAPHWPREYGGMEATLNQQIILKEEFARAGAPELSGQGLNHIGPILMQFGTPEQKAKHLPPILAGDVVWCQGYSEPNAGSDLASLTTRGDVQGDHIIVNGQKIWTTWAHHAHWIFALIRTDPGAARKQAGISFILIDMKTPGIKPSGIKTIAGDDEFAQVFFDNVRVPITNLVGKLNDGWKIANSLLVHERLGNANPQVAIDVVDRVRKIGAATGMMELAAFRDRLARLELDLLSLSAAYSHAIGIINAGRELGPDSSFMKIVGTELLQRATDLLIEAAGAEGASLERIDTPEGRVDAATAFLQSRRATIYGGSGEIQRNILSKRVLTLP
ncbi:MAG: acyl-CoA dehydrogenase [Alphaproteobacteria bacterium]|nr:acyl-CoA dehydrogenase [Alphaproteobacteria bacterium]